LTGKTGCWPNSGPEPFQAPARRRRRDAHLEPADREAREFCPEELPRATARRKRKEINIQFITVKIENPDDTNFVLGQTHFIKSVEDIHEALVAAVPGIEFGLAFCEASGKCLVRWSGTDPGMIELAKKNAAAVGAGHSFILFLGGGFYPLNVLNTLKMVPEVCRIFCATANPTEVVLAETEQGRGILGVVDGSYPKGVKDEGTDHRLAAPEPPEAISKACVGAC
jgi:adenosine/AMP kinase